MEKFTITYDFWWEVTLLVDPTNDGMVTKFSNHIIRKTKNTFCKRRFPKRQN